MKGAWDFKQWINDMEGKEKEESDAGYRGWQWPKVEKKENKWSCFCDKEKNDVFDE